MAKYKNKYRIESARLKGWDYRNPGAYFITICIKDRRCLLGECINKKMKLSTVGAIVQGFWFEIPKHNAHVRLGEFVVMPNHIHGILILDKFVETLHCNVSSTSTDINTDINTNTDPRTNPEKNKFFSSISPKSGSVSRILQQYKTICGKHIDPIFPELAFDWQERFHDHIIRTETSFKHISNYIVNNPEKWDEDTFNDHKKISPC